MNKLSTFFKNIMTKWKNLSSGKKIAFSTLIIGGIIAIITLSYTVGSTKYDVLFNTMDAKDSAAVYAKLTEKKVKVKLSGDTILVPKDQVDELRMEIISEVPITEGSQGFELLDKTKFGATDAEMKINYQRALQGELERTIKIFPQVEGARVNLVIPDDTVFVRDTTLGKAFATIKLKPNQKLTAEQVKSIVSLISGSVRNIPKENVEVTDTVNLLTKGLYNKDGENLDAAASTDMQQKAKLNYEQSMEKKALDMLETTFGRDKVKIKVNAELNFDAVEQQTTTYDPNHVAESEQTEKQTSGSPNSQTSASPVDNAMSNNVTTSTQNGSTLSSEKKVTNYKVSSIQDKTIKAPGELKKLTASVVMDGNIDDATKASVRNLIISTFGIDEKRGDIVTVEGIPFNQTANNNAKKDIEYINNSIIQEKRIKMYKYIGIASACLFLLIIVAASIRKKSKNSDTVSNSLDVLIGEDDDKMITEDNLAKPRIKFKPMELDVEDEKTHVESEIRKYASDKPEQVADIIKSWLAEDER